MRQVSPVTRVIADEKMGEIAGVILTVKGDDVNRAADRTEILSKLTGEPALAMVIATKMDGSTRELAHRRGVETALRPEWGGGRSSTASEVATGKVRRTGLRYQTITPVTPARRPKTAPRPEDLPNGQRPRNTAQTRINRRPKTTLCCSTGCGKGARPLPSHRNAKQARADTGARPRTRHQLRQSNAAIHPRSNRPLPTTGNISNTPPSPGTSSKSRSTPSSSPPPWACSSRATSRASGFSTSSPTTSDPTT